MNCPAHAPAGDRLHQAPAPELLGLRKEDTAWRLDDFTVYGGKATLVPHVSGSSLNVDVELDTKTSSATAFSVLLVSDGGGEENGECSVGTTAVTVDWQANTLQARFYSVSAMSLLTAGGQVAGSMPGGARHMSG